MILRILLCPFKHLYRAALFSGLLSAVASAHGIMLGVGTHFINYPGAQPVLLDLTKKLGADSVRADTGWKMVETTKGVYKIPPAWDQFVNNARDRGIEPLLILDYGNGFYDGGKLPRSQSAIEGFVRFATFVVTHFAGRVHYYEVWNEWNTGTGGYYPGGSAEAYSRLFDATYAAIKRVDPGAVVLAAAGYGDWYEQIARLGVAARADGVAIHPYVPKEPGYQPLVGSNGPERSAKRVMDVENAMSRLSGGKEIPLYITEIGWSTSTGKRGYPEQDVASMAERSLLMFAALPYVRGVWWYDLIDDGPDSANPEARFGLFRQHYEFKPAGRVIESLAPVLRKGGLTWDRASNLDAGLVVLDGGTATQPWKIAWDGRPLQAAAMDARGGYSVMCAPSLKVEHAPNGRTANSQSITPMPMLIAYHAGQCSRKPVLSGN